MNVAINIKLIWMLTKLVLMKRRPMEKKLKYHIDKLMRIATSKEIDQNDPLNFAPQPSLLIPKLTDGIVEEGQSNPLLNKDKQDASSHVLNNDGIYRAPRMASVPYEEGERKKDKEVGEFFASTDKIV